MKPDSWEQLDRLFHEALGHPASERSEFLREACAGDESLLRDAQALVSAHEKAERFIEKPALQLEARSLANDHRESIIGRTIGHYRILSVLGAGGMGEVYLAEDSTLGRKIALKLLPEAFTSSAESVRRFQQEARAASALNHPNILTVHQIGQIDNRHFIATEFIDGQTLRDYMGKSTSINRAQSHGREPKLNEVLNLAIQTADALSAAHEAGIVHRDIKPENIMIRRRDSYVKVLDFGLAKLTETPKEAVDAEGPTKAQVNTNAGLVMGTVGYLSPEQARGEKVDSRTDIWSLGVVLYEMVAGSAPFAKPTASEVIALILERDPPPLSLFAPDVPVELQRIVSKTLEKDKEQRYQTAKDLLVDLRRLRQQLELDEQIERMTPGQLNDERLIAPALTDSAIARTTTPLLKHFKLTKRAAAIILGVFVVALIVSYVGYSRYAAGRRIATIRSLAVLPFSIESNQPDSSYLSEGISESIINSISQLPGMKVTAASSSSKYKGKNADPQDVAKALGVEALLTGKVTQLGDNLSISVELMNANDKTHIWGAQYNRKAADLLSVQSDISREIVERLRQTLSDPEKQQVTRRSTENLKAFQYYMQGRSYAQSRTREDLFEAIRYCEKATNEDRNYARAYACLAEAYAGLGVRGYMAPAEARRRMEEVARKSLELDENLAEAHVALGSFFVAFAPYNFAFADGELRRATELSPSLAFAHQQLGISYARQGRLDESANEMEKARELDPLSASIARQVALPYFLKRDYERALELLLQANELGPPLGTIWEVQVYIQKGRLDETLTQLEKLKRERKNDPNLIFGTGMIYAAQGKRAEAVQVIRELEQMSGEHLSHAQYIAKIYSTLNDKEMSLSWLERGVTAGAITAFYKDELVWDRVRDDSRFREILRRIGVT